MPVLALCLALLLPLSALAWSPSSVAEESTLEFLTTADDEGEHWSTVWFVVIDDRIHLRLGPRAAARIEKNRTAPRTKIRFGDGRVEPMRYEDAAESAAAIDQAMYEKYWTDVLGEPFRKLGLTGERMMLRLVPDEADA
jgi:hypothetical protein